MKNQLKTILLLGVMTAILVGIGGAIGQTYLYVFGALALAMNLGAYFFSDRILLRMSHAREVTEEEEPGLHRMVAELAVRAEIPKPRVFVMEDPQPNAFATGRNPEHGVVAVTTGIVRLLTERELRGVLAHELAHIKNRDILVATIGAVMAGVVSWVANALSFAAIFGGQNEEGEGGGGAGNLLLAFLAPVAATFVQLAISRSREYLADETGAKIAGDPQALASGLAKLQRGVEQIPSHAAPATASLYIANPLAGAGGMTALFSTHPPMEERIRRLLEMVPNSWSRAA